MRRCPPSVKIGSIEVESGIAAPLVALFFLLAAQAAVFTTGVGDAIRFVIVNFGFE